MYHEYTCNEEQYGVSIAGHCSGCFMTAVAFEGLVKFSV